MGAVGGVGAVGEWESAKNLGNFGQKGDRTVSKNSTHPSPHLPHLPFTSPTTPMPPLGFVYPLLQSGHHVVDRHFLGGFGGPLDDLDFAIFQRSPRHNPEGNAHQF